MLQPREGASLTCTLVLVKSESVIVLVNEDNVFIKILILMKAQWKMQLSKE